MLKFVHRGVPLVVSLFACHTLLSADNSVNPTQSSSLPETIQPEIVVTATRTPQPEDTTAASVTVINRDEIESKQYQSVADALRSVPGVPVVSSGPMGQDTRVFIRGTSRNHTSIYIDGRPVIGGLDGSPDIADLTLDNVDHIEVVRGGASTLYGANTIGGVINIVTRSGKGQSPSGSVLSEGGSFNTFREAISSLGSEGPFDYSIEAGRLDTDFQRPNNEYRLSSLNSKLGYQIVPDLYADTVVRYSLADAGSPSSVGAFSDPSGNLLTENWDVSPGLHWKTGDLLNQDLVYSHDQQRQVYSSPLFFSFARTEIDTDRVDYQNKIQPFNCWTVLVGTTETDTRINYGDTGSATFFKANQTSAGIFAESEWEIVKDWNLINGVRYDHFSDYNDALTWRAGTSYRTPVTHTVVHGSFNTAYAAPSPQNLYFPAVSFGGVTFASNPNLKPEKSDNWEFGVEQPLADDKVKLTATYFRNDLRDLIATSFFPTPTPTFMPTNVNQAKTEGVELGLNWSPLKNIETDLNYTYLTAENESTHQRLILRPRHTFNATVIYTPIPALVLTAGGSYVQGREDIDFSNGQQIDGEDYFVARFTAGYDINKNLNVFLRVENAFNEQYAEVIGFPALDQAFYGGVKVSF